MQGQGGAGGGVMEPNNYLLDVEAGGTFTLSDGTIVKWRTQEYRLIAEESPCEGVNVRCTYNPKYHKDGFKFYVYVDGGPLADTLTRYETEMDALEGHVRWCAAAIHAEKASQIVCEAAAMGEGKKQ